MSARSIRIAWRGLASLVLVGLSAVACSSGAATSAPDASTAASTPPSSGGSTGVVVNMATTSLGPVLTSASGLTLYVHAGDTPTSSTCTGGCATAWPPLTVATGATATAGTGVPGKLGTLVRADGTTQVTYNGMPLYGWKDDTKPGDVTGQGVNGFSVAKVAGTAPSASSTGGYGG